MDHATSNLLHRLLIMTFLYMRRPARSLLAYKRLFAPISKKKPSWQKSQAMLCTWLQKEFDTITTQLIDARAYYKIDLQIQDKLAKAHA